MNLKIHFYVLAETGRPRWNQDGGFERVWEKNSQFNNENYTKIEEGQKQKKKKTLSLLHINKIYKNNNIP